LKTLILGGVKSGKSRLAERLASNTGKPVIYIATAQALDEEMRQRIELHQAQRPNHWRLIEEPIFLANCLQQHAQADQCILVDCLTLWLNNLLCTDDKRLVTKETSALLDCLHAIPGDVIFVTNETNMGIIPMGDLSRRFCDEAGKLHQALATSCDNVILTVAGLPQVLKGQLHE